MSFASRSGLNYFLSKLRVTFAPKNHVQNWGAVTDVTVNGTVYHTFWAVAPTGSNQVYGTAFHPTTGQLYSVYNNKGVYSVENVFTEAMTTTEIDTAIADAGDIPDSSWKTINFDAMTTSDIDAAINAAG